MYLNRAAGFSLWKIIIQEDKGHYNRTFTKQIFGQIVTTQPPKFRNCIMNKSNTTLSNV